MQRFVFQEFFSRFNSDGLFRCPCGREHRLGTRTLIAQRGALRRSAEHLRETRGPGVALWVLSDENTDSAAGAAWKAGVQAGRLVARVLPARPRPSPTMELAVELAREARAAKPDLLVSVGSGVISDLVKRISLDIGVPNWCIATAASVDAFTSATASIHVRDFHNAVPAAVSETVICDLDVIEHSPRELLLAGLGDLLAKFIAYLDWNLARLVTAEHYCVVIADTALESARKTLAAARAMREAPAEAARTLTDAVLTSGLAMQAAGGSRSAASAEHMMAHFWETADAARNEKLDLHGILVGAASRLILGGYRAFYGALPGIRVDRGKRLRDFDAEKPWQETLEAGLAPYRQKVSEEMGGKVLTRAGLLERLERFEEARQEISALAAASLNELEEAVDLLGSLGFPFSLDQIGISRELCLLPFRNVRLLRARYSSFDLAYELGTERLLHEEIERRVLAG